MPQKSCHTNIINNNCNNSNNSNTDSQIDLWLICYLFYKKSFSSRLKNFVNAHGPLTTIYLWKEKWRVQIAGLNKLNFIWWINFMIKPISRHVPENTTCFEIGQMWYKNNKTSFLSRTFLHFIVFFYVSTLATYPLLVCHLLGDKAIK